MAALALGASESSVKRWIDEGRLLVERTAGGHRRIPVTEVVRFAHASDLVVRDPVALGLAPRDAAGDLDEPLYEALAAGDLDGVRDLLSAAALHGLPIARLGDGPLRAALERLGTLWQHGPEGIAIEHRATAIVLQAVEAVRALLPPLPLTAPLALGGGLAGDPYLVPSALAAAVLHGCGLRAHNLGPDTPVEAFEAAIARFRPLVMWCSVTGSGDPSAMATALRRLAERLFPVPLIVGGRRLADLRAVGLRSGPNLVLVGSLQEMAAYVGGLHLTRRAS
jgi:excisionase family DNA binding protein